MNHTVTCPRCGVEGELHIYETIRPGKPTAGYVAHITPRESVGLPAWMNQTRRMCQLSRVQLERIEAREDANR